MPLTGRQVNVMDHALAYPKMYRNRYCATKNSLNADTWKELCSLGFAEMYMEDSQYEWYRVTDSGLEALNDHHRKS